MSNPRAAQLVEAGMWLRLSGDHEGARRLFEQALKLDPENEKAKQLLEGEGSSSSAPPVSQPPAPQASNPFAPAATTTAMDLDWGSATGFAPTPIPFIAPVEIRPAPVVAVPVAVEPDLPVESEIVSMPPPTFDGAASGELIFGQSAIVPPPAPTTPERWATNEGSSPTMMFQPIAPSPAAADDLPWAETSFNEEPAGSTMQFARPSELGPPPAAAQAEALAAPRTTMEFARPSELQAPLDIALSSTPTEGDDEDTIEFVEPRPDLDDSSGEVDFIEPKQDAADDNWSDVASAAGAPIAASTEALPPADALLLPMDVLQSAEDALPPMDFHPTMEFLPAVTADLSAPAADEAPLSDSHPSMRAVQALEVEPAAVVKAPVPVVSEPKFTSNATSAWDHRSNPGIKLNELHSDGAALDLVTAARPAASPPVVKSKLDEVHTLVRGAKDLLGLDDHTGAMDLILKAQELAPNDPEVQALRSRSESTLEAMFESKLGQLSAAPRVKLKDDEIIWLNLDHRAGFVLAQIDGQVSFEDLFSVSGMSRLDTARILAQLIEEGVISH